MKGVIYKVALAWRRPVLAAAGQFFRLVWGVRRLLLFLQLGYRPAGDISHDLKIKHPENLSLGSGLKIGPGCSIGCYADVFIGDDVTLSQDVIIESAGLDLRSDMRRHTGRPVRIEKGAWLGTRSIVLAGVSIGEGSVVGAGETVRASIPPHHVLSNGKLSPIVKQPAKGLE